MDILKKLFPVSFNAKEKEPFIISLIIYVVLAVVGGLVLGFLSGIPVVGIIVSIVGGILDLYALIGIVLAILVFVKVIE